MTHTARTRIRDITHNNTTTTNNNNTDPGTNNNTSDMMTDIETETKIIPNIIIKDRTSIIGRIILYCQFKVEVEFESFL